MSKTCFLSFLVFAITSVYAQSPLYGQCGGEGWTGSKTCVSGAVCSYINTWYSQCIPGTATPSPTSSSAPTPTPTPTPTPSPTSTPTATSPGGPAPTCSALGNVSLATNKYLPDPFKFEGVSRRAANQNDWECRRQEIKELFQRYELGTIPPKPASLTASFSGSTLTITAAEAGKSVSFSVAVSRPASCTANAPCPAIIAFGAASIPVSAGVATIVFANDDVARDAGPRGTGKFYTLYGTGHSAGAMAAWSWGVSRIIDGLEAATGHNIDPRRVGVTGCSRYGKASLIAGAMDTRVALTVPQEAGTGGSGCYRIAQSIRDAGGDIEAATNMMNTVWMGTMFQPFSAAAGVYTQPTDHHLLAALVAPRGLLVIDQTGISWLGPKSVYGCMKAATKAYEALGARDAMGISMAPGHDHCALPSAQNGDVSAFMGKFLLKQSTNTVVDKDNGVGFSESQWVNWSVPALG